MTATLLRNAALGLVTTVLVGLVPGVSPLAPVVGGGVAGSLQRADARGGAVAGAVTGLLWTLCTLVLLVAVVVGAGITAPPGVGFFGWLPAAGGGAFVAVLFLATNAVVVVAATIGGAIGGLLGGRARTPQAPTG